MSANNQIIVAPYPKDLDKYAVWHDGCVDNPFDYSTNPLGVFDTLEEAVIHANKEVDRFIVVEYGIHITTKDSVQRYEEAVWDEFPDYKYLAIVS